MTPVRCCRKVLAALTIAWGVSGCLPEPEPNPEPLDPVEDYFVDKVQPFLDDCRSCHVPAGRADIEGGRGLLFALPRTQDYASMEAAWIRLGRGVETSPLLTETSDPAVPHEGGKRWSKGNIPYNLVRRLLTCWEDEAQCADL